MKNNKLYLVALVTFVLLVASFSLDSYILDMAESYLRERSEFCVTLKTLQRHHIIQSPVKING